MSVAAVFRHPSIPFNWAHNSLKHGSPSGADECQSFSTQPVSSDRPNWFRGRLPTPPTPKTMTRVTLGLPGSDESIPQSYPPIQLPFHDGANGRAATHLQNKPDNYGVMSLRNEGEGWNERLEDPDVVSEQQGTADDSIASYLQIPESVNKSKGSLAEFAAEVSGIVLRLSGWTDSCRSRASSGLRAKQHFNSQRIFPMSLTWNVAWSRIPLLRRASANG